MCLHALARTVEHVRGTYHRILWPHPPISLQMQRACMQRTASPPYLIFHACWWCGVVCLQWWAWPRPAATMQIETYVCSYVRTSHAHAHACSYYVHNTTWNTRNTSACMHAQGATIMYKIDITDARYGMSQTYYHRRVKMRLWLSLRQTSRVMWWPLITDAHK